MTGFPGWIEGWIDLYEWTELARGSVAVLLTGFCVRWLDDCVDAELDGRVFSDNEPAYAPTTSAGGITSGATDLLVSRAVYSALFLGLACALDTARAVTLFLCSYSVGMLGEPVRRLPLGITSRQESLGALLVAFWAGGWNLALASLGALVAIQVADDVADETRDALSGASNLVRRWGAVEALLLGSIALLASAWADPLLTTQAFTAVALVQAMTSRPLHAEKVSHEGMASISGASPGQSNGGAPTWGS